MDDVPKLVVWWSAIVCIGCAGGQSTLPSTPASVETVIDRPLGSRRSDDIAPLLEGVPSTIVDHLQSCQLSLSLHSTDAEDSGPGIRRVHIYMRGGEIAEGPPPRWHDGSLRVGVAEIRERFMARALAVLVGAGFFESADESVPVAESSGDEAVEEPHIVLTLSSESDDGRRQWRVLIILDHRDALLPLWELAFELHESPDLEGYAYLAALFNQAEAMVVDEQSDEKGQYIKGLPGHCAPDRSNHLAIQAREGVTFGHGRDGDELCRAEKGDADIVANGFFLSFRGRTKSN